MIKTGDNSIKTLLEGKVKLKKEDVIGKPLHLLDIVTGHSDDNGDYGYFILEGNEYISIPSSSFDIFAGYAADAADIAAIRKGNYDVIFNSTTSKKGRQYYTCYLEIHKI